MRRSAQSKGVRTALLVEDDEHVRALLASLLRQSGFERVLESPNTQQALEYLHYAHISLALVDLALGEESGSALIAAIRAHPRVRGQDVAIVAVSAATNTMNVQSAIEAGADGFIAKPVTIGVFNRQVAQALRRRGTNEASVHDGASPAFSTFEID